MSDTAPKKKYNFLSPGDWVNVSFLTVLSFIDFAFITEVKSWYIFVPVNIVIISIIILTAGYYELLKKGINYNEQKFSILKLIRYWYAVPVIIYCFKQTYHIIDYIKPHDIDRLLIQMDFQMFGVNPTEWVYRFANPYLTEFLQIIYFFYYFLIIVYGLELYLWKRYDDYKYAMFTIVTGFYISYIFYMIFPAVGPRFILHNFNSINTELPGIFLTEKIRAFLDFGESIPAGTLNPIVHAQRDAMPSAHVTLAILLAYLSHKIKSKSFYFYLPYCVLMTISTIYLRYHYVVDIFAGLAVVGITILICEIVNRKRLVKKN